MKGAATIEFAGIRLDGSPSSSKALAAKLSELGSMLHRLVDGEDGGGPPHSPSSDEERVDEGDTDPMGDGAGGDEER